MSDEPWWWSRCTHREVPSDHWFVARETEHVVVIQRKYDVDLARLAGDPLLVHFLVEMPDFGSVCKTMSYIEYDRMSEQDMLELVQAQARHLREVNPRNPE